VPVWFKGYKREVIFMTLFEELKELGVEDKVKAVPKGEGNKSLPDFFLSVFQDTAFHLHC